MRVRRRLFALLGAAGLMLLGEFQPAEACPGAGPVVVVTSPSPGESNVPTNAVIDIVVFADQMPPDLLTQFALYSPPGSSFVVNTIATRVDSSVAFLSTVRLTPSPFLNPIQNYEIRQSGNPRGTFLTTSAPDIAPPSAPIGATATVNTFDSHPDGGSDCITDRIRQVRLSVPAASKPVVYTIKDGAQVITSFDSNLTGSFYCSGQARWQGEPLWVISPGQHTVQLSAIDRAGNSSTSVDVSFNASCAGGPDGGSPDGGSGSGSFPGNDSTVPVQSSGCSSATGTPVAIVLAAFAAVLMARRRGRDSSTEP